MHLYICLFIHLIYLSTFLTLSLAVPIEKGPFTAVL